MSSIGVSEAASRLKQFIQSFKHERLTKPDSFDLQKWRGIFSKLFEFVKSALDGPNMNEQALKDSAKVISPLLCELICETVPPNLGPKQRMTADGKAVENAQDIKIEICEWLKHSKFAHSMEMQHVEQVLRHCVYHENEATAIHWYENITIPKFSPIRAKYKQWKNKYSQARRSQTLDQRALIAFLPGKQLFELIADPRNDCWFLQYIKPMTLLIQIVKDVTERLQNPIQWIKTLYPV